MNTVKKRKGKKIVLIVLAVIIGIIVVGSVAAMLAFEPGRREAMNLTIDNVDFSKLHDGVYVGEYKGTHDHLRDAKVQVTVASGAVSDIKVIGGTLAGEKQTTEVRNGQTISDLFGRVLHSQSLQVDLISGATITSKVHLEAVENALEQAEIK